MKNHSLIFLIFFSFFMAFAQQKQVKRKISYLEKAERIYTKDPNQAISFIKKSLEISIRNKNEEEQGNAYVLLGKINESLNQRNLAIENYQKAILHFQKKRIQHSVPNLHFSLGNLYQEKQQYDKALNYFFLYRNSYQLKADKRIAHIYFLQKKYNQALIVFQEILKKEEKSKNLLGISETKAELANLYLAMKNTKEAEKLYTESENLNKKALQNNVEKNDYQQQSLNQTQESLGKVYRQNKQFDEEISLRKRSIERGIESNDYKKIAQEEIEISNIYIEQGFPQKAIDNLNNRIVETEKAASYKTLSKAYKKQKKYEEALKNYQLYVKEQEKILKEKEKQFSEISVAINQQKEFSSLQKDFDLQQQHIALLEQDKQLKKIELLGQKRLIYSLLFIIIIILIATFFMYKNAKERRIANQLLALKSLRSQMNPHFIFNALNSVNQFIAKNDERTANQFLTDFSRLMRLVLENSQKDFVSLDKELKIIKLYLKLEHNRFRDLFNYEFEVDESIQTEDLEIPPMLIQPYIENAIWHGLRYKEIFGKLLVKIQQKNGKIHIYIEDDGIGRKKSLLLKTKNQQKTESTGLKNTQNRLEIINKVYHKNFNVIIKDLTLEETGTSIEIIF